MEFEMEGRQDIARIAQILEQLDQLSDDEVRSMTLEKSATIASA